MSEGRLRRWTGPARWVPVGLGSASAVLTLFPGSWTLAQIGAELSASASALSQAIGLGSLGAAASEFAGHPVLLSAALAAALLFWFAVGPLAVDGVAQLSGWTGLYVGQTVLSAAAALAIYVAGRIEERRCGPGETVAGQPQTDPGSAAP